jgi:hypothetical protein
MFEVENAENENERLLNAEKSIEELRSYFKKLNSLSTTNLESIQLKNLATNVKNLEQRFHAFIKQSQDDERIKNLNLMLNSKFGVNDKLGEEFNLLQRQLEEIKLKRFKEDLVRLFTTFEEKVKVLYSNDDDPLYCLIDAINCINELKKCMADYEKFLSGIFEKAENCLSHLKMQLQVIESKKTKSDQDKMMADSLRLAIESKSIELHKMKEIKIVREKINNFEKLFCKLKSELD